jgi:MFS family permease
LAPNMGVLIFGRALHGLGGGGLSSMGMVVLGDLVAPKERGKYYAYFTVTYTTAGGLGPLLGGFLAEHLHWSVIFWINIPMGLAALAITTVLLRRLPRYERPHRLDIVGAILIVLASVSFMLALNMGGVRLPWTSWPVLALLAVAMAMAAFFVVRLMTAPEPLIPVAILANPIIRFAIAANSFGWGAIIGLNIVLPIYLQGALGLSPTHAGLSLVAFLVAMNTSAGLCGQVLGRVRHYKRLPMALLLLSIGSVAMLAWWADRMTIRWFEALVILVGIGFGALPSLTNVAMQNVVPRHQLGISIGTMNFTRNLYCTILIAVFGAIILGASGGDTIGAGSTLTGAAFRYVFVVAAASLSLALIAIMLIEEKPLLTNAEMDAG